MVKKKKEIPSLVKLNQLQQVYKNLYEEDEDGNPVELKMRANVEFKERFNEFVYEILLDCVSHARGKGRRVLTLDDVPTGIEPTDYAEEEEESD